MACETTKYVGRDVVLEYAIGCGDELPQPGEWKRIGAMRTKTFGLTWDTTDATADDSVGALRENLATFQTLEMGGDGVAKADDSANLVDLTKHVINPVATNGQPVVWMRMTFPDLTFTAFMLVSDVSRNAPYDDVVTYSLSASATASDFGLIVDDTPAPTPAPIAPTMLVVIPETAAITDDAGTLQLSLLSVPANATKTATWVSGTPGVATVDPHTGLVTAVSDGTTTITATSTVNGGISATRDVIITNQT